MLIRSRAPLRLGLAGGGTDVSPYCDNFGGCVLNTTINRYAYAIIKTIDEPVIRFVATDLQKELTVSIDDPLLLNGEFDLHKAVYKNIVDDYGLGNRIALEVCTFCDAPAGSGLGSSSTLVVAMIKGFSELLNIPMGDYEMARLAFKIERLDCGLKGGRQDQYSATFGGFNFMEFYSGDRAIVNQLRIKDWIVSELEASLLLFYTGVSRESAQIIADQKINMQKGDSKSMDAFHGIKSEALQMKESLLKGDFSGIVDSMRFGWENKKKSAASVSNELLDEIYQASIDAGALAGKVSGAGGGGFMMFFVPPDRRMSVIRVLNSFDGQVSNAHFTNNGAQAWRVF